MGKEIAIYEAWRNLSTGNVLQGQMNRDRTGDRRVAGEREKEKKKLDRRSKIEQTEKKNKKK